MIELEVMYICYLAAHHLRCYAKSFHVQQHIAVRHFNLCEKNTAQMKSKHSSIEKFTRKFYYHTLCCVLQPKTRKTHGVT